MNEESFGSLIEVTDFVANGSFEALRKNVDYLHSDGYAVLVRLVDHNSAWSGPFVFVGRESYKFLRKSSLSPGDVVVANVGANAGTVFRVPDLGRPMTLGPNAILCRPKDPTRVDRGFLYYYLTSPTSQRLLSSILSGSAQPKFNKTDLRALSVAFPPTNEQQAIAEVLGALDDKIAANDSLATTAEHAIAAEHVLATRAGARPVPLLGELRVDFGEPFAGSHFSEPGIGRPLIRIRDLKSFASQVWTTESRPREIVVAPGDIVVGMDAEFRATPWRGEPGVLNQRVMRVSHARHGNALVHELLRRPLAEVENEKSATTVIHLNKADLARKNVLVPSAEAVARFEAIAEPLFSLRIELARESRTLAATRDALLPHLMSGKLRVRDVEAAASTAGV